MLGYRRDRTADYSPPWGGFTISRIFASASVYGEGIPSERGNREHYIFAPVDGTIRDGESSAALTGMHIYKIEEARGPLRSEENDLFNNNIMLIELTQGDRDGSN